MGMQQRRRQRLQQQRKAMLVGMSERGQQGRKRRRGRLWLHSIDRWQLPLRGEAATAAAAAALPPNAPPLRHPIVAAAVVVVGCILRQLAGGAP